MKRALIVLCPALVVASANPSSADDLSMTDLGHWADSHSSGGMSSPQVFAALGPTSVPKTGTATYSGVTAGVVTTSASFFGVPSTGSTTMTGTSSMVADFSHQSFTASFGNFNQGAGISWFEGTLTEVDFAGDLHGRHFRGSLTAAPCNCFTPDIASVTGTMAGRFFGTNAPLAMGSWQTVGTGSLSPAAQNATVAIRAGFAATKQ